MARINIEDTLYKQDSFIELILEFGSKAMAIGVMVEAFTMAQKHYLSEENGRLIPMKEWDSFKYKDQLSKTSAVVIHQNGVYVRGSKEQFAWLIQKQAAGQSRSPKKLEQLAKARKTKADKTYERGLNETERGLNGSEALTLTLTPTLTLSPTHTPTLKNIKKSKSEKIPTDKSGGSDVWDLYRFSFKNRYGVEPIRNAKVNAQCKQIHERLGKHASDVIEFYMTHNDGYYLKQQHSLGCLLSNAEALFTQSQRGIAITGMKVREAEKKLHSQELIKSVENYFTDEEVS